MFVVEQYNSLFSLYIYLILLLPALILGLCGRKSRIVNISISIAMLTLLFGVMSLQMVEFIGFFLFEIALIYCYFFGKNRFPSKIFYYAIFVASIAPLFLVKWCGRTEYTSYIGFIGISYISFKIWEVILNIHDEKIKTLSILDLLSFLLFAPSFSSGPILRWDGYIADSQQKMSPQDYCENFLLPGIKKIILGMLYKFSIAFLINQYILLECTTKSIANCIGYMYGYTLYLFFDFAGYSLMAVGTGYIMGIHVPDNFNMPFLSRNIKEFWQRWHISLSTWFNDYLFSRFVLNTMRIGLFKDIKTSSRCAYILTMFVMGLWHGLYLHYIVYGLYHGILLVLTDIWVKTKTYRKAMKKKHYNLVSRFICFHIVAFGMLIFSGFLF